MKPLEFGGWPAILERLVQSQNLDADSARAAVVHFLSGTASDAQIAAFAVALRSKGETVEELGGLLDGALELSTRVELPDGITAVDTCGTGGSTARREGCFNVSTIAALVIAGAGGVVCKHGGRAAGATSSAADLLEGLGVAIDLGPSGVVRCVTETNFGFCFAPRYQPAMLRAAPIRRELGIRTFFNIIGPMSNPARVRHQVLGVSDPSLLPKVVAVLSARGTERAWVVHGSDGLDELTTAGPSNVLELHDGTVRSFVLDPSLLGLSVASPLAFTGGDVARNVDLAGRVLGGERGPHRDIVVLNAAGGLVVGGVVSELSEGVEAASGAIDCGAAADVLQKLVSVSRDAWRIEQETELVRG